MPKITKKAVDAAIPNGRDYVIWDSELPGFGLRVFASGKRSYVLQYRSLGRSRRYTIGLHGVWTPEMARLEAKAQLGRIARGDNPAEEKRLDHRALTVKQLCDLYRNDLEAGLILGKGGRPKKASTIYTDLGRIKRHIVPLLGNRRVKDLTRADATKLLKDVMAGNTRISVKTEKLRGKSIVRGGPGTASRTLGLFGAILTYAINAGIIDSNPAHGIRKPKDQVRQRRLTEAEYRELGRILAEARRDERFAKVYNIDYGRCIFCGFCVEACPKDAITHGYNFEISVYNRTDLLKTKDDLLITKQKQSKNYRVALSTEDVDSEFKEV